MRRAAAILGAFLLISCVAACRTEGDRRPQVRRLLITGSSTMLPLVTAIAARFRDLHPEVEIEVQGGGSGRGIAEARSGKADIGMSSHALLDRDQDVKGFSIARDGVGLIVHKDNPVRSFTRRQLIDIYKGRIVNWREVGGRDEPIAAITRPPDKRSSAELFVAYFDLKPGDVAVPTDVRDNAEIIATVAATPNALAYMSIAESQRDAEAGVSIRLVPFEGIAPTIAAIRRGQFPISRSLNLVTKEQPKGLVREFIDFAMSPQVSDLILAHEFVPYID